MRSSESRRSTWKAWLDATSIEAARRVCARIAKRLELDLTELVIEPYRKGGYVAKWVTRHESADRGTFLLEVIEYSQRLAAGWHLSGSVDDELEAIASRGGNSRISVAGITMLSWSAVLRE